MLLNEEKLLEYHQKMELSNAWHEVLETKAGRDLQDRLKLEYDTHVKYLIHGHEKLTHEEVRGRIQMIELLWTFFSHRLSLRDKIAKKVEQNPEVQ